MLSNTLFAQTEETIFNDTATIHFKTFGEGNPILIINGGPGMNSEGFIPLAKSLSKNHKTIVYDQRGTGKSLIKPVNTSTITLDKMVSDIECIRKHLNIDTWIVLGHSFGGMMASYYATKHPDTIKGLILSSSGGVDMSLFSSLNLSAKLSKKQRDSLSYWNQKISRGDTSYHARLQRGKYLAPAYLFKKEHLDKVAVRLTQGNTQINSLVFRNMRAINFDLKLDLKNFKAPTLIIQGKEDIIPIEIHNKTKAVFKNGEAYLIDECAHYGWLEQPEIYFSKLNNFSSRT